MNISKFTQKSMEAVNNCEKLAYEFGNQEIEQEHLLYSLLTLEDSLILKLVEKMESIKPLLSDYIINHDVVYQALLQTFLRFANDRLETYGKSELLKQPEFANDADKLKKIIVPSVVFGLSNKPNFKLKISFIPTFTK